MEPLESVLGEEVKDCIDKDILEKVKEVLQRD